MYLVKIMLKVKKSKSNNESSKLIADLNSRFLKMQPLFWVEKTLNRDFSNGIPNEIQPSTTFYNPSSEKGWRDKFGAERYNLLNLSSRAHVCMRQTCSIQSHQSSVFIKILGTHYYTYFHQIKQFASIFYFNPGITMTGNIPVPRFSCNF